MNNVRRSQRGLSGLSTPVTKNSKSILESQPVLVEIMVLNQPTLEVIKKKKTLRNQLSLAMFL